MSGTRSQRSMARWMNDSSRSRMAAHADLLLELEDEAGADRLDDGRRAGLLAMLGIGQVDVLLGVDVRDRAATHDRGHPVVEQLAARDQHAGRAGAADELVGRDEHRVLVVERVAAAAGRHLDVHVRRGGGEVPATTARRGDGAGRRRRGCRDTMPVTLEAAEKLPIRSGRSA